MSKVLFYIHSLNKGGAEKVLLTIAEELNKEDEYEVAILTDTVDELEYDLPKDIRRIDLREYISKASPISRILGIRRAVRQQRPDRFIVFMIPSVIKAVLATIFSGYKVIAAVRSNPDDDCPKYRDRLLLFFAMSRTERIVCQTEYQAEYFPKKIRKKCTVISNPIFREFEEAAKKAEKKVIDDTTGTCESKTGIRGRIVATGRLFDYKNHKLMIRAFSCIAADYPDVDVVVYGEGPYRSELEEEIERLGLKNRVLLPGDSTNVARDIADALIYVLPSDSEGLPNALMEAMALGLPVISTDCPCGGPRSLISDAVNGLLTPVGDVDAMAKAMESLLRDDTLRKSIGKKAMEIRTTNSIDSITAKWKKMIGQ